MSGREKVLLAVLICAVAAGQFRTLIQVGGQFSEMFTPSAGGPVTEHPFPNATLLLQKEGQTPDILLTKKLLLETETATTIGSEDEEGTSLEESPQTGFENSASLPISSKSNATFPEPSPQMKAYLTAITLASNNNTQGQQQALSSVVSNHLQEPEATLLLITDEELSKLQEQFYTKHAEQMASLFPTTESFIVWSSRNKEKPYRDFWSHFPKVFRPQLIRNKRLANANEQNTPYVYVPDGLCAAAKVFRELTKNQTAIPHVLFLGLFNENWGGLSDHVANKTTNWSGDRSLTERWERQGCSPTFIANYLEQNYTRAVVVTQFQSIYHPKVHSLPLGLQFPNVAKLVRRQQQKLQPTTARQQLLMINHKGRPMRKDSEAKVLANFNGTAKNTHGKKASAHGQYYTDLMNSKFILAPSGLGFDCYRIYEALYLGCIPVIEHLNRQDGWFRTFVDLPVAFIDSYDNLTPQFLEREYIRILQKAESYRYEKLTKEYWIQWIQSHAENSIQAAKVPANPSSPTTITTRDEPIETPQLELPLGENDGQPRGKTEDDNEKGAAIQTQTAEKSGLLESPPLVPGSQEEAFYRFHGERIFSLVNSSSAIVWNTRGAKNTLFEPLWENFDMYKPNKEERKNPSFNTSHYLFWGSICEATRAFLQHREKFGAGHALPHVHFFRMNENWGGFSEYIPDKTAEWVRDLVKGWKKEGCSKQMIWDYLDHPDTLAAFTMQFQQLHHPKVHSLPLGILNKQKVGLLLKQLASSPPHQRTQLLMINSKPRPMRAKAVSAVIENFHGTIRNTYGKDPKSFENYWNEMKRSKFILSPGGLGIDCYRHWEAIVMGTIPVVETLNRTDAWFETFDDLPVVFVDAYDNLTPEYLEREYERIISKARTYKYEKLTKQWWVDYIKSFVPADAAKR